MEKEQWGLIYVSKRLLHPRMEKWPGQGGMEGAEAFVSIKGRMAVAQIRVIPSWTYSLEVSRFSGEFEDSLYLSWTECDRDRGIYDGSQGFILNTQVMVVSFFL